MMEMDQNALRDLEEQAFEEGYSKAREDIADDIKVMRAQYKRLKEILEVEGDQSLMDAAEQLSMECRAHRESARVAAMAIENRRLQIVDLQKKLTELSLWYDKEHAAWQNHLAELRNDLEPKARQLHEMTQEVIRLRVVADELKSVSNSQCHTINELRQALLKHVTETA